MPQAAQAQEDTSFLEKYKTKPEGEDASFLDKYRADGTKPIADQGTMGPQRVWKPGEDQPMPLFERIENYTPEGRKAHPILSRIGDATRNAKEMLRTVGPEISLLSLAP